MSDQSPYRRPEPSPWLIGMSILWMLLFAGVALGGGAWHFMTVDLDSANLAIGAAVVIVGLALALAQWVSVFRRRIELTALMTVLYFLLSGASGLPLFLVVFFAGLGEYPRVLGVVATISLLSPAVTISMAVLMLRWTRRLEEHRRTRPNCAHCGYNLLGSLRGGQNRCPECGNFASPAQVAIHGSSGESTAHADPSD